MAAKLKITVEWCNASLDRMLLLYNQGCSTQEVARKLNVSLATFYRALQKYPTLKRAHEFGVQISEARWMEEGRLAAFGLDKKRRSSIHWIFTMKNRFGWRDKIEIKDETAHEYDDMADDDLNDRLLELLQKANMPAEIVSGAQRLN